MTMSILNLIIPGFSPDPSICRIGDTFFLVNSSFHLFPGLPIYASKDLKSFTHTGNAINRHTQLALKRSSTNINPSENGENMIATGGLFAPSIRHFQGVAYIFCTNAVRDHSHGRKENFFIQTDDIRSGEWSDAIYFPLSGIDPSVFFDDDGRVYVQGSMADSQIICFEMDLKTGKLLTEQRVIWTGWDKRFTEGPISTRKTGARSRKIWGPYDAYEKNPIWTAYGTENYIQHTGHADLFQDTHDRWWMVMLGVRKTHGRFVMGRETFLAAVDWPAGEWPSLKPVDFGAQDVFHASDRSRLDALPGVDWVFLRDFNYDNYQVNDRTVRVTASNVPLTSPDESPSFIGKRQRSLEGSCMVNISVRSLPVGGQLKAGLALYKDEHRFIAIGIDSASKQVFLNFLNKAKNLSKLTTRDVSLGEGDLISLKCNHTEMSYEFCFRTEPESSWSTIGTVDTLEMSGYDYVGPVFGLFATGETGEVLFEDFSVDMCAL